MDTRLDPTVAEGYTSKSQRSRVITEAWAEENFYCIACGQDPIEPHSAGRRVEDFYCPSCDRRTQLKATRGGHGKKVANSAYDAKVEAIQNNSAPDYAFMGFDPEAWQITELTIVPGHFITLSVVEKRKPLSSDARRAGWVGSNLLLDRIPHHGRIAVVTDGRAIPKRKAMEVFEQTSFLAARQAQARGWLADILACLDQLRLKAGDEFELADVYQFEGQLKMRYPDNQHIKAKIRQQLQVLRDEGMVEFLGGAVYKLAE